jgi:hypothetical protein
MGQNWTVCEVAGGNSNTIVKQYIFCNQQLGGIGVLREGITFRYSEIFQINPKEAVLQSKDTPF